MTPAPTNSTGVLSRGIIEYAKTAEYDSSTSPVLFLRGSKLQHLPGPTSPDDGTDDTPCPWSAVNPDDPFPAESIPQEELGTSYPQPPDSITHQLLQVHTADIAEIKQQLVTLQNSVALSRTGPSSSIFSAKQRILWAVMQALQRPLVSGTKRGCSSSQAASTDVSVHFGVQRTSIKVTVPCSFALFTELVRPSDPYGNSLSLKFTPPISSYYLQYNPAHSYEVFSKDFRTLGGLVGLHDPTVLSRFMLREANVLRIIGTFGHTADDSTRPAYLLPGRSWDPNFVKEPAYLQNRTTYSADCPFYALRLNSTQVKEEALVFRNKFTSSYVPQFDFRDFDYTSPSRDKDIFRISWTPPHPFTRQFRDLPLPPASDLGEVTVSFPTVSFRAATAADGSPVCSSVAHQVKSLLPPAVVTRICSGTQL